MKSYVTITVRTFTIWIVTAVLNGLLCGTYLFLCRDFRQPVTDIIFMAGIGSLFLSIPGFFIFWLILLFKIRRKFFGRALFRAALSAAILLALGIGVMIVCLLQTAESIGMAICIVVSAISSIMIHYGLFKNQKQTAEKVPVNHQFNKIV